MTDPRIAALAAYLGACLCLTWAVLTAIAHFRVQR